MLKASSGLPPQLHLSDSADLIPGVAPVRRNKHNLRRAKPLGGFWTSSWDEETRSSAWSRWSREALGTGVAGFVLLPYPDARVYEIVSRIDLAALHARFPLAAGHWGETDAGETEPAGSTGKVLQYLGEEPALDFEAIGLEYDALHLTTKGERDTRQIFDQPNLWGWDCESTLWFRWAFSSYVRVELP